MLKRNRARADSRALLGAVAIGSAMGLLLGASYLAGGAARAAMDHARVQRLAAAAKDGFSDEALLAEASAMEPGALAVARRHDPFTATGWAQRDWETTLLAARLETRASAGAPLLRTGLAQPSSPTDGNALTGARDLDCLSAAVYYEARGESKTGQQAVAQVVLNRVRHPAFPKTVCGVVYQGAHTGVCQFSFACDGSTRRPREAIAWREARSVAARALSGFVMRVVGNSTHFHVANLGAVWGVGLMRVAQIGAHVFYKFSGRHTLQAAPRPAPDVFTGSPELAQKPVYAEETTVADGGAPQLILASATTPAPAAPAAADAAAPAQARVTAAAEGAKAKPMAAKDAQTASASAPAPTPAPAASTAVKSTS